MELGTKSWRGESRTPPKASSTMLTLEKPFFDLLFIKVCIVNALLGPKCRQGR